VINITQTFCIPENEIEERFILASGPGGQNVNKVATAVQLRFNIHASTTLPAEAKHRLHSLAQNQITQAGVLIIESREHRSQIRNREMVRSKFAQLIRKALKRPEQRHKTKPTKTSQERRLNNKKRHGKKKQLRQKPPQDDKT